MFCYPENVKRNREERGGVDHCDTIDAVVPIILFNFIYFLVSTLFLWAFFFSRKWSYMVCLFFTFICFYKKSELLFYYAWFGSVSLKLLMETCVKISHENMNPCIFFSVLESFLAEMKIFYRKWGLHQSKTAKIASISIMKYVIWELSRLTCKQFKCSAKKRTILLFSVKCRRYRDFL